MPAAKASAWDSKTLRARISDAEAYRRFEAGSPNETEVAAYAAGLPHDSFRRMAVVLGMTPELRSLATRSFKRVVSIDKCVEAIKLYAGWVPKKYRSREIIIEGEWLDLPQHVSTQVSAVLGDGIFGNLANLGAHHDLLSCIRSSLSSEGRFVTRKALIPTGFDPNEHNADALIDGFRKGRLDEAEFAFGMRILGHYRCCYDAQTYLLDNVKLFAECERDARSGRLTAAEHALIRRYYFGGKNCILPQSVWERVLKDSGFAFHIEACRGRSWYDYYKVYVCTVETSRSGK